MKKSSWSQTGLRIQILIQIGRVVLNPDPVGILLIRAKTIEQFEGKQWGTHIRKEGQREINRSNFHTENLLFCME